jgi:hypothetical protein
MNILPFLTGETDKSPRQEYVYILRDKDMLQWADELNINISKSSVRIE